MIIDFHTHVYPKQIADSVIKKLSGVSSVKAYTDATTEGLIQSCINNDITNCVILPVVTNPNQTETINRIAIETNENNDHLISFGGIHPDDTNYKQILSSLSAEGILGIKLHPVFQKTYIDDSKYLRIIDCAYEQGLIVSVHAGLDINNPDAEYASVFHINKMLMEVAPNKMILAHMGGHLSWDEAEDMLTEYLAIGPSNTSVYLDTAFCLPSPISSQNIEYNFMTNEQFVRMVRLIGADHVLFGTDSPWTDHGPSIQAIMNSGLNEKEISCILYENAKDLLNLTI